MCFYCLFIITWLLLGFCAIVQRYHSAMDQIMAVNSHRHKHLNEIQVKRMNISGKNESVDEGIIQVNKGRVSNDFDTSTLMVNCLVLFKLNRKLRKTFLSLRRESNPQPFDLRWDALSCISYISVKVYMN